MASMKSVLALGLLLLAGPEFAVKSVASKKAGYYEASANYLVWKPSHPLAKVANPAIENFVKSSYKKWIAGAEQAFKEDGKPTMAWDLEIDSERLRSDPRVISVIVNTYDYTGGAHPNHGSDTLNFAFVGGKPQQVKLNDLFKPGSNPGSMVSKKVIAKLMKTEGADWVQSGELKTLTPEMLNRFVIGSDGLTWLFNPYDVGPYAAGDFEIKLTWKELGPNLIRAIVLGR